MFRMRNEQRKVKKVLQKEKRKTVVRPDLMEALGGTLIIEVIEGKLDRDTEEVGKMDCFVEVKYKD